MLFTLRYVKKSIALCNRLFSLVVERDDKNRIAALADNKNHAIKFNYNNAGLLTEITDVRGRRTAYRYSGDRLTEIEYADGYFTFDGDKTYAAENFQMPEVSFSGDEVVVSEGASTVPVLMRFENSWLVFCSVNGLQYSFTDYGTTVVTMPEVGQ